MSLWRRLCSVRWSLQTLVLASLLMGSGVFLYSQFEPWQIRAEWTEARATRFAPDDRHFFAGSGLYSLKDLSRPVADIQNANSAVFSPDAKLLATVTYPDLIQVWRVPDGKPVSTFSAGSSRLPQVEFSPDSKALVMAHEKQSIEVRDLQGNLLRKLCGPPLPKNALCYQVPNFGEAHFSPDGAWIVALDRRCVGEFLWLWHAGNGRIAEGWPIRLGMGDSHCGFSKEGDRILVAEDLGTKAYSTHGVLLGPDPGHTIFVPDRNTVEYYRSSGAFGPQTAREDGTRYRLICPCGRHRFTETADSQKLQFLNRPEDWWGLAWLPEFWLTVVFAFALVWSIWRDRRTLAAPRPMVRQTEPQPRHRLRRDFSRPDPCAPRRLTTDPTASPTPAGRPVHSHPLRWPV